MFSIFLNKTGISSFYDDNGPPYIACDRRRISGRRKHAYKKSIQKQIKNKYPVEYSTSIN